MILILYIVFSKFANSYVFYHQSFGGRVLLVPSEGEGSESEVLQVKKTEAGRGSKVHSEHSSIAAR